MGGSHTGFLSSEFCHIWPIYYHISNCTNTSAKLHYSLNATGTQIWQGLKRGLPLQEISRQLQEAFEVEAERAERSVLALVSELVQHQLVQRLD
jgi:hypothetical protein